MTQEVWCWPGDLCFCKPLMRRVNRDPGSVVIVVNVCKCVCVCVSLEKGLGLLLYWMIHAYTTVIGTDEENFQVRDH